MKSFLLKKSSVFVILQIIAAAWCSAIIYWMHRNDVRYPHDPNLRGTAAYGTNAAGDFQNFAVMFAIETAVFVGVCALWRYPRIQLMISTIALCAFGAWTFVLLLAAMHSGSIFIMHILGLIGLDALFLIAFAVSIIAALGGGDRKRFDE